MKLYLTVNKHPLQGYVHVDPSPLGDAPKFVGNFSDLSEIVSPYEALEIIAEGSIDFIPSVDLQKTIQHWYHLLAKDGKLIITGTDLIEFCKTILLAEINIDLANELIFQRKGLYELSHVTNLMKAAGFKIVKQKLQQHQYMVEATK